MTREEILNPKELIAGVIWMTYGDGNITIPAQGNNGYFQVSHTENHEDYIQMKAALLSNITSVSIKKCFHSRSRSYNWQLWTKCHPVFTKLKPRIYLDGRKILSEHAVKMLSPLCLAILYQDDGRYNKEKSVISINKPLFSRLELEFLAKYIVDTYGLIFRVHRSCKLKDGSIGHEMGLRSSDRERFFDLIRPYVVPSMSYKVTTGGSASKH